MYRWLMPLFLLTVSFASCPDPSNHDSCDGTPCSSERISGCCPNSCGTLTLINETLLSRIRRSGEECSSDSYNLNERIQQGCSVCVCKYNRLECIYKGCRACLAIAKDNSTTMYKHGELFKSGCLECTCNDGALDCAHKDCLVCDHKGNTTQ